MALTARPDDADLPSKTDADTFLQGAGSAAVADEPRDGIDKRDIARKVFLWRALFALALLIFVVSCACLAYIASTYMDGQRAYDDIADASIDILAETGGYTLADFEVDWDGLRSINPDIVGWIYIPQTAVNYPIAQRAQDDSYYLEHNFSGTSVGAFGAEYGCIMLSGQNSADFSDQVNIIYGHNMKNGSMFAQLARFASAAVFDEHRTIYLLTPHGNYELTTFAVDRVLGDDTDIGIVGFDRTEDFYAYVQARLSASLVAADPLLVDPESLTQVFAFSTCDGSDNRYRIVTFCGITAFLNLDEGQDGDSAQALDADGQSTPDANDIADVNAMAEERIS